MAAESTMQQETVSRSVGGYTISTPLGTGAFGKVYQGSKDSKPYALKQIIIGHGADEKEIKTELETMSRLQSSNYFIEFIQQFLEDGVLWIVLQYCGDEDLNKYILAKKTMRYAQRLDFTKQVAMGVKHLHDQNLIHRDIKPDNIIVCHDKSGNFNLKIADFGFSRIWECLNYQSPYYDFSYSPKGPPYYTAPEVFQGNVTIKSDIFSLGCLVMAMFSRTTIPWIGGKPLLAPYIGRNGGKQISDASGGEKLSFIREHVKLPCGDQVKLQNLVASMVDENWRNRPNAREAVRRANDIGAGFCNIL